VPSFSEHTNAVLLRYAIQNGAAIHRHHGFPAVRVRSAFETCSLALTFVCAPRTPPINFHLENPRTKNRATYHTPTPPYRCGIVVCRRGVVPRAVRTRAKHSRPPYPFAAGRRTANCELRACARKSPRGDDGGTIGASQSSSHDVTSYHGAANLEIAIVSALRRAARGRGFGVGRGSLSDAPRGGSWRGWEESEEGGGVVAMIEALCEAFRERGELRNERPSSPPPSSMNVLVGLSPRARVRSFACAARSQTPRSRDNHELERRRRRRRRRRWAAQGISRLG
jgi:hypothetical protein